MPADHQHDPATVELVRFAINDARYDGGSNEQAAAVLDALTAAGWRPPPPQPDGIHWRVGTSIGRTIYDPHGHLFGLMDTSELAAAFVAAMNREVDRGRVIGYLVDGQRYHPGNVQIVMEANDER